MRGWFDCLTMSHFIPTLAELTETSSGPPAREWWVPGCPCSRGRAGGPTSRGSAGFEIALAAYQKEHLFSLSPKEEIKDRIRSIIKGQSRNFRRDRSSFVIESPYENRVASPSPCIRPPIGRRPISDQAPTISKKWKQDFFSFSHSLITPLLPLRSSNTDTDHHPWFGLNFPSW